MQRRNFLTMMGATALAPILPAFGTSPAAAAVGYNRYQYGLAVFHARTRANISAAGIAHRLKVSVPQAEAMIGEMIDANFVQPVLGSSKVKAISNITKPDMLGFERTARQSSTATSTASPHSSTNSIRPSHSERTTTMNKFTKLSGIAAPMPLINIDTDMIIPKQFLKTIKRSGLGVNLFDEMRYDDDRNEIPDFVLNKPQYRDAQIIVAGDNFGCGSSREHAPWAIADFGITCVIAPSYADIFYNNCFKNGILPIVLPQEQVDLLMKDAEKGANARIEIDLESQSITSSDGEVFSFDVDPFKKHCLMNGLDDIGLTMEKVTSIDTFEAAASQSRPWV
jgi:3-isopropylmalate/(R)-2-methylmalate dehydratase small subunit